MVCDNIMSAHVMKTIKEAAKHNLNCASPDPQLMAILTQSSYFIGCWNSHVVSSTTLLLQYDL